MAEFILNAEVRTRTGKGVSRRLRVGGYFPAVIYGKNFTPIHCSIPGKDVELALQKASRNTIFKISVQDHPTPYPVIIRDYQTHHFSQKIKHLDFQFLNYDQSIQIEVDFKFEGEPIGRKSGAIFTTLLKTVRVECLPNQIPEHFVVDVSKLDVGHSLHISDLSHSQLKIISKPKLTICQMSMIKEEAVATPTAAAATPEAEAAAGAAAAAPGVAAAPAATAPKRKEEKS